MTATTDTTDFLSGVPAPLRAAMQRRGFTQLTDVQQAVLAADHASKSLRISSATGSGKTVALGLVLADVLLAKPEAPSSKRVGPSVLVITPTRELAIQVQGELGWLYADVRGVDIEVVTGGVDIRGDFRRLARRPAVLVATPGRLLDHIRSGSLDCSGVTQVVLDEADQMLDMGFRPDLEAIVAELPEQRRSHLISATFPRAVRELAERFQGHDAVTLEGTALGRPNEDIETRAYLVSEASFYPALVNLLLLSHGQRCLVFVRRRIDAAELAEKLAGDGFSALPFSGELAQNQRLRTLEAFRQGIVHTLISTDVAARGIDVPDIAAVIHADLPEDVESLIHRSGRTGRAGRKGTSSLLVPFRAERRARELLRIAKLEAHWGEIPAPQQIQKYWIKQTRKAMHAELERAEQFDESELSYAAKLLEGRDPARLIATLLRMSEPKLPREPMDPGPPPAPRHLRSVGAPNRAERPQRGERPERGDRRSKGDSFVDFEINWGHRGGATPARILAHVCRRGDITSRDIGAVRIDRGSTRFGISAEAAEAFARNAAKPDQRDPKLRIQQVESA